MSVKTCLICGKEFLSEADPYAVIPTKYYALVCFRCFDFKNKRGDKISQLKKENAELKSRLVDIHLSTREQVSLGLIESKDKLITELKEELAKERECVEFYGDQNTYNTDEIGVARIVDAKDVEPEDLNTCGFQRYFAGKRARQRIKERKEF